MGAIRASHEALIDATPEVILDALADMDSVPSWSDLHKNIEVVDTHPDGRPFHVKVTFKIMGITDKQTLEYHWGRDWVVWDAEPTFQQHGQHVEYNLTPEAGQTRVRFDITIDLTAPVPHFLIKRAKRIVLDVATEGLRQHVARVQTESDEQRSDH